MKRITFFTKGNKYIGFKKLLGYKENFLELRSWILSENYVIINNNIIDTVENLKWALT